MKKSIALLGLALEVFEKQAPENVCIKYKAPPFIPEPSLARAINSKDYYRNFYSYVKARNQRQKRKIKRARPF